jgi:hypothetical protein
MDPRREKQRKLTEFRRFMPIFDLWVTWYPLDRSESQHSHPIYDEGPERRYEVARSLQVFWAIEQENLHMGQPEGRLPRRTLVFGTDANSIHAAGFDGPWLSWFHIDDVIKFRDEYFSVYQYEPKGHLGLSGHPTVVHVEAHLRDPQIDLPDDLFPSRQVV